jgi:hypothetical protein
LKDAFSSFGLVPLRSDASVFSCFIMGTQLYALAYVDDVLLIGTAPATNQVYEGLSNLSYHMLLLSVSSWAFIFQGIEAWVY